MISVVYRLNRGPFVGQVKKYCDGPYAGWYAFDWCAGEIAGGTQVIGKAAAISGLQAACLDYFVKMRAAAKVEA
jgi:hypothetical protein